MQNDKRSTSIILDVLFFCDSGSVRGGEMFIARLKFDFWSKNINRMSTIRIDFDAKDRTKFKGKWKATDAVSEMLAEIYFGKKSGVWDVETEVKDKAIKSRILSMREYEDVTGLSVLWTYSAKVFATFDPGMMGLFVGDKGTGMTWNQPVWSFDWEVVLRG